MKHIYVDHDDKVRMHFNLSSRTEHAAWFHGRPENFQSTGPGRAQTWPGRRSSRQKSSYMTHGAILEKKKHDAWCCSLKTKNVTHGEEKIDRHMLTCVVVNSPMPAPRANLKN